MTIGNAWTTEANTAALGLLLGLLGILLGLQRLLLGLLFWSYSQVTHNDPEESG